MDEKLYTHALKFLARRPRSEKEVIENLKKKKASETQIKQIIDLLKKQKFLSDFDFATWWIEQRQILKPMGWRVLELELKQKGISKEIIDDLRFKIKDLGKENEFALAMELAEKRMRRLKGAPKDEIYRKLGGFLGRRGFDLDTIKAIIDHFLEK